MSYGASFADSYRRSLAFMPGGFSRGFDHAVADLPVVQSTKFVQPLVINLKTAKAP